MAKINDTSTYTLGTPTSSTILLGSDDAGGDTKNFTIGSLFQFLNLNPTLSTLLVTGDASFEGGVQVKAPVPANASATGTIKQIAVDTDYIYVCTATDTWKRVAITTW